jgi:3-oxoacyl-[acyl-carrier protein] reductase
MFNPMSLAGKKILLTGASSGIGRDTAILLAELGARLVLVARSQEKLEETFHLLPANGHMIAPFDLAQSENLPIWIKGCVAEVGILDGLVHCAGIHLTKPLKMITLRDYQTVMDVNVGSVFSLTKAFCQKNIAGRPSSVVLLASIAGILGQPGISAYAASKGALIALTKSLAMETSAEGIRVNCIAPGVVETAMSEKLFAKMTEEQIKAVQAMHPLGLGKPRDVANAVAFLMADTSRWITGSTLVVDGGYSAH